MSNYEFDELDALYDVEIQKEIERIENSKPAQRLLEKTQVLVPVTGRDSIAKNRLTHSYEVSTSSKMLAAYIANSLGCKPADIDYKNCLKQVCLLHDIGHPPFGHDGQEVIDKKFRALGVQEGFSDNNNNLVVMEAHDIKVRNYVKASVIKYPEKLYAYQKEQYKDILQQSLAEDKAHFAKLGVNLKNQKTTITCQIMDEADRNSYTCSDLADFFTLGNEVDSEKLKKLFNYNNPEEILLFKKMIDAIETKDSRIIKKFFSELKNDFNANYKLTDNGLTHINPNLHNFRESLSDVEYEFFIKPIREEDYHINNMKMLDLFVSQALEEDYCKSKHYRKKIDEATNELDKNIAIRDMVSEVSDWFVIKHGAKLVDDLIETLNEKIDNSTKIKQKNKTNKP
jgi:dGTP triphosphohydrolase